MLTCYPWLLHIAPSNGLLHIIALLTILHLLSVMRSILTAHMLIVVLYRVCRCHRHVTSAHRRIVL